MDYCIFDLMEEGEFCLQPGETIQRQMERTLKAALESRPKQAHIFNDMLCPEFVECNARERSLKLKFPVETWQQNPNGLLHGGIIAAMMDVTFGILSRYYAKSSKIVTVQMSLSYMRRISMDSSVYVIAKADKAGKRISFLSAQLMDAESEKAASEASAVFMVP